MQAEPYKPTKKDPDKKNQNDSFWWQSAVSFFYQVSSWIIGPVLIALFLGKYLDSRYKSEPKYFLICVLVAFVISNIGLVLQVKKYIKSLNQDQEPPAKTKL